MKITKCSCFVSLFFFFIASFLFVGYTLAQDDSAFRKALSDWETHYKPLIDSHSLRDGNFPQIMHHEKAVDNAIVLVHGLTDSPFFMKAIGDKFCKMGFNVLLPLLPGHGLKDPAKKMKEVTLKQWQDEVDFAVKCAQRIGKRVSIGGLSTGGALSTFKALQDPNDINGGVFLFSAALDIGDFEKFLLSSDLAVKVKTIIDEKRRLGLVKGTIKELINAQSKYDQDFWIGDNPYRYSTMSYDGARQLKSLIEQIQNRYPKGVNKYKNLRQPVFAAHSEADKTAKLEEIDLLINNHNGNNAKKKFYRIKKCENVDHASVVLATDIRAGNDVNKKVLEYRNPLFEDMMLQIEEFVNKNLSGK